MTPTKPRYARIEEKAPALTWACERSWKYIVDKSSSVKTNHKPLVPVLSTPTLDQLPGRIQRFKMGHMTFHFEEIKDVLEKKMYIADVLSTVQTWSQAMKLTIAWEIRLQQIMEAQEDPVYMQFKVNSCEGRLDKCSLNDAMKLYWSSRSELSVVQNILLKASRIVILSSMHLEVLDNIHEEHQGITKCCKEAKKSVWKPGLSPQIHDLVQQCRILQLQP